MLVGLVLFCAVLSIVLLGWVAIASGSPFMLGLVLVAIMALCSVVMMN